MMPLAVRLAVRNLTRNKRRTALTVIALIVGTGLLVLGEAFLSGTDESIIAAAENGLTGHLLARPAGYPKEGFQHPVDTLLDVPPAARELLDREAAAWTGRLVFSPQATTGQETIRVRAIGYDPERDERVFSRALWRVTGRLPARDADEILVGRGVARLLRVAPGDRLVLQVRTHRGAINALDVRVAAVLVANNSAIDGNGILLPLPLARRLVAAERPTHLSVRLARRADAEAFRPRLAAALGPQADVVTWVDETRDMLRLQGIRRKALNLVVLILLTLAGFGTANTILMAAYERVREVGTLRSLGMTEGAIRLLFFLEGGMVGLIGGVLGAAWGCGLSLWWSRHPIDFSAGLERATRGDLAITPLIYTRLSAGVGLLAVGFAIVVAVLASVYPARVASRMLPADAVRGDA